MKTFITALAIIAILATSAVAKAHKTKAVGVQPNHALTKTSAIQHYVSFCDFHFPQTDPDPIIRSQLLFDCKNHESE